VGVVCLGTVALLLAVGFGRRRLCHALPIWRLLTAGAANPAAVAGADVHDALEALLAQRRVLLRALAWHVLGWASHVAETWLALLLIGAPISVRGAIVIESLAAAARTAAFFIPAGLGAQDGAVFALARSFGVGPEAALGLAVVKRLRELVVGAPAIVAWLISERGLAERLLRRFSRRRT
jgi:hypothetical protein